VAQETIHATDYHRIHKKKAAKASEERQLQQNTHWEYNSILSVTNDGPSHVSSTVACREKRRTKEI
jgi:hypothetical protein